MPLLLKLFSCCCSPTPSPSPVQAGPEWSTVPCAPTPGAASGAGALWEFSILLYSLVGSSLGHHLANDIGLGWASFPAGDCGPGRGGSDWACLGPSFPLCSLEGRRGSSGPQIVLRPEPQAKAGFPLAACILCLCPALFPPGFLFSGFLGFLSGRLLALPKTPSREFACCHEIMQMRSWGCLGNSSLCPGEGGAGMPVPLSVPSPATHLRGQTPLTKPHSPG